MNAFREVYVSTVIRGAELGRSGHIFKIDWKMKEIIKKIRVPIPVYKGAGERGGRRGGRGISKYRNFIIASNYDSLIIYDKNLNEIDRITSNIFCGIHELASSREGVWVSSTGMEAIVLVDVEKREVARHHFITENDSIVEMKIGINRHEVDKEYDHRDVLYSRSNMPAHLNCVYTRGDEVYCLLSNLGVLLRIEPDVHIVLEDKNLRNPHNIQINGKYLLVNNTGEQSINKYSLYKGELIDKIDLNKMGLKILKPGTILWGRLNISVPGWLRGMSRVCENRVLVGVSPASIVEVDLGNREIVNEMRLSRDVNNSIHGLVAS